MKRSWIRTDRQLPQRNRWVICWVKNPLESLCNCYIAHFDFAKNEWRTELGERFSRNEIALWSPIPQAPELDEQGQIKLDLYKERCIGTDNESALPLEILSTDVTCPIYRRVENIVKHMEDYINTTSEIEDNEDKDPKQIAILDCIVMTQVAFCIVAEAITMAKELGVEEEAAIEDFMGIIESYFLDEKEEEQKQHEEKR